MREEVLRDEDLFTADEAFLTSTTREVVPIVKVDESVNRRRPARPITHRLLPAFAGTRGRRRGLEVEATDRSVRL